MENEYLLQVALELKDQMSKQMEDVNRELSGFKKELKAAGVDVDGLGGKVQKNTVTMKGALASLSKVAKVTTVALVGIGAASVKSFADTEYSVKKVQTISTRSFDEIKAGAYDLAKKYGGSVDGILEANYQLVSSMGDIAESQYVMETASQLSLAGFTTLEGGMNALTSVMNAYKMEIKDVGMVADTLMTIQNAGITNINELQASLYNVLPTAASLKVSFLDISAAMATMTNNKVPTAQATTQLRQALVELAQGGSKADKVFRQIAGESFQQFIASGGNMAEAFELIANSAEKSNMSLYDIFGSTEAVGAILNVTGENMEKFKRNQEAMSKSSGTLAKGTETMVDTFKTEYNKLKAVFKEVADTVGEQLVPYLKELKTALESTDFKDLLSKDNIERAVSIGKGILTVSAAVWGVNTAANAVLATLQAIANAKAFFLLVSANPVALAVTGVAGGTALLLNKANDEFKNREKEYKKLQADIEGEKKILEDLKNSLSSGLMDDDKLDNAASILRYTKGYDELKKVLADGDIQKGLEIINDEFLKLEKIKKEEGTVAGVEVTPVVPDTGDNNSGGDSGKDTTGKVILTDDQKKALAEAEMRLKEINNLMDRFRGVGADIDNKAFAFDFSELEKAEEKLKSLESILNEGLDMQLSKDSLSPIIQQYQEAKKYVDQLKNEIDAQKIKDDFEKEFANLNLEFEIFGTEEEDRLLQTVRTLESQISKAISEGMIGNARELGEELKVLKEQYKEQYELPKKAAKEFDDNLKGLSSSVYQVADLIGGDFQKVISSFLSGLSTLSSSLSMMGVSSSSGGLLGSLGGFLGSGTLGMISGGLGIVGAVGGVVSSLMGSSDEKRKKKNAENERKFEENTNALKELGEQLKANTATLQDFANTLIASIATSPTLHRIAGGQNALKLMEEVMMENKDFGKLSFLVKEKKKTWYGKSKSYSKDREMSEKELLELMGYDSSVGLDEFDLDELKKFRDDLNSITESVIRDWASGLTSRSIESIDMSAFEQYKKNIDEFIKQIEMLQKEQKELFRNATLEGFEGINVLDEKQLTEQYTQMFNDMGIDASKYKDTIQQMVDDNKVLVSSMEDVRSSFIDSLLNGEGDFVGSMGSYFQKLIKNAAMTVYDTLYSEIDNSMNEMFLQMSEKLVEMKESGNVDFTDFWKGFDFSGILEAQEIESNFQLVIDDLRNKLIAMGIGEDIIDSFLPVSEAQKKINEIKDIINNGLSSAMSQALTDKDFDSFEKSLGQSIYNSVKDSLIKAFIESETYKQYIDKYFNFEEFEKELSGVTDPKKAFEMMQEYLEQLYGKLESNGMGFDDNISANKDDEKYLGNSYYTEGPSQININITQHFTGVYGEDAMYKIAKEGVKDGLEEVKNQSKALGVM